MRVTCPDPPVVRATQCRLQKHRCGSEQQYRVPGGSRLCPHPLGGEAGAVCLSNSLQRADR